jgi:sugar phosphate isomerase/epimerase
MIQPGLVSVTFRKLTPAEIVELVHRAGLVGIEWGGDIHVPHGDLDAAGEVCRMTEDAGLQVAAYGSYYRVGQGQDDAFGAVLDTAVKLGAPKIRVWAGEKGSADADEGYHAKVAEQCRRIATLAADAGVEIVSEWHGGTLTDTTDSAIALLDAVGHENFRTYWQPIAGSFELCLSGLDTAAGRVTGLHVYQWDSGKRLPLAEGRDAWLQYLAHAAKAGDMFALLEFVRDDEPAAFLKDAETLCGWLAEINS